MSSRIKGITVEIGGDTTKLQTALKDLNSEIKSTQSQLKDVEKLLKIDPGNTELLVQRQKLLGEAVSETKEKLDVLKSAAEEASLALENKEISKEQYDALQREIIETEQSLKNLETQANQSSGALQKLSTTGESLKKTGDAVSGVGKKLLPATAVVSGLGALALKTASDFESSMSQVQATMGIAKDSISSLNGESVNTMDALSELAKEMGETAAFSATECAEALNYLALSGYSTQEMADTLPTVLNLAAAGGIDLASASDMVTDAMSALGMETSEAGKMVDEMAKTASTTNTSVAQLGEGILTIGATAKSIKGGTAELNTALGILANNGIKGAEGGTHLRNIILSLQNPTDKAADAMKSLGVKVYDSEGNMRSMNDILGDLNTSMEGMTAAEKDNIISKIFNKTDLASVNSLLANTGSTWDSLQSSILNSSDAAQKMADTQLDNLQGQLILLKSALEGLAISFGQLLMPALKKIVGALQKVVDWLNSLDDGTKRIIVTVGLVVGALGPVLIFIGKIITAVGTIMSIFPKVAAIISTVKTAFLALNAAMLANPIGLIIASVTALIAVFALLWNKCEGFRNFWLSLWEGINNVVATLVEAIKAIFMGVIDFVANNWQGLLQMLIYPFSQAHDLIYGILENLILFIQSVLDGIISLLTNAWMAITEGVKIAWMGISEFFTSIWEAIKTIFMTAVDAIKTLIETWVNTIKTVITTVFTAIQTFFTEIWTAICSFFTHTFDFLKNLFTTVWNEIKNIVSTILNALSTVISNIWNGIKETITGVMNVIKNTIEAIWNAIKTTVSNIVSAIKSIVSNIFHSILSGIKSTMENIAEAIKSGFETAINFITSLPSKAFEWGKDIISGMVDGINSAIGAVGDAVCGVADTITSFLHFSVPDEGPLTEYESWMPDFMEGLARGIERSKGVIRKAVEGVSNDMVINPNLRSESAGLERLSGASTQSTSSIVGALREALQGVSLNNGDTIIPVYIGGTMLDEIVVSAQQRMNLRSGGR